MQVIILFFQDDTLQTTCTFRFIHYKKLYRNFLCTRGYWLYELGYTNVVFTNDIFNFYFLVLILKIKNKLLQYFVLIVSIILGFLIANFYKVNLFWSLDVAIVSLFFYGFGFYAKDFIKSNSKKGVPFLLILGVIHLAASLFLAFLVSSITNL